MSLFRRKHERGDEREERPSAQPDSSAEARGLEPDDASAEKERSPGVIAAPVAGEIISGSVEVQIVSDRAATEQPLLEWSIDGTSWQRAQGEERAGEGEGELLLWDTGSLDDGSYLLRLVALLPDGNELPSEHVSVLVDNAGPEILLPEPLEGRTLSGFVSITVAAEDLVSDVSLVELEISAGGEDWRRIAEARRQPFELRWSSEALTDGAYRLRIGARDASGNLSLIGPFEVEIANAPGAAEPAAETVVSAVAETVAAELVDPGEFLHGRINLIARAPDPLSTQLVFELAKAGSTDWRALGTTRAPFHLPVDTTQIEDGSYELRIESINAAGKSVYSRPSGPHVVDNTPPTITISKPAAGETLRDRAELVVEVADDTSGPALVELNYNEGDEWIMLARLEPEEGKVRGFWQLAECRPGSCRLRATASDRAGNESSEEITVIIAGAISPQPEQASEPEAIPARPRSSSTANRFGQVPSWDWKRRRSSGAEQAEATKASSQSREPDSPAAAKAEPTEEAAPAAAPAAAPKKRAKKSAAWTWKSSPPRPAPKADEQPEPKEEPAARAKIDEKQTTAPEPEATEQPESEPKQESASARAVRLVESAPSDEQAPLERAVEKKPPDSGTEKSASVVKVNFARAAHGWDIWALDELVEETPGQDPAREEERRQTLYYLRQHTSVDGRIPPGFEDLIYELFGELMPDDEGA